MAAMQHKTPHERIEACQGLVHSLAAKIRRGLPKSVELDDLIGYGQLGLAEAAANFDPERGVKFSTFAYYRIRGAIYDGLTQMSWFRKSRKPNVRYEQRADEVLEAHSNQQTGGTAASLENEVSWFRELASSLAVVYMMSGLGDADAGQQSQQADPSAVPPSESVGLDEQHRVLRDLVETLPDDERTLIRCAYYDGLTMTEAAERIGKSKSWASRLHAKTLNRLANSLKMQGLDN